MWNLCITFPQYRESLWELLEFETEYAVRMAQLEGRGMAETMVDYTEWYYASSSAAAPRESKVNLMSSLLTVEERRSFFQDKVVPEQERRFSEERKSIRQSYSGFIVEREREYYSDSPEYLMTLHFRNFFAPASPFEHIDELASGLLQLTLDFHSSYPETRRVQCASWLNNVPRFCSLFPPEWTQNRTLCLPMEASTGWWGSLIDRTGQFSKERAEQFRKRGGFAMPNMHCRCEISSLLRHLKSIVGEGCLQ